MLKLPLAIAALLACLTFASGEPLPQFDPAKAVGHLRFGAVGAPVCSTGTLVLPRRRDGRWHVLTAAHCVREGKGVLTLKDGRSFAVAPLASDAAADLAWLVSDSPDLGDLPAVRLAPRDPEAGAKVWQAGWGVDRPLVRKEGSVLPLFGHGKVVLDLSSSAGDSGGGIFGPTGELVAVVSGTTQVERKAMSFGGGAEAARKLLPAE